MFQIVGLNLHSEKHSTANRLILYSEVRFTQDNTLYLYQEGCMSSAGCVYFIGFGCTKTNLCSLEAGNILTAE